MASNQIGREIRVTFTSENMYCQKSAQKREKKCNANGRPHERSTKAHPILPFEFYNIIRMPRFVHTTMPVLRENVAREFLGSRSHALAPFCNEKPNVRITCFCCCGPPHGRTAEPTTSGMWLPRGERKKIIFGKSEFADPAQFRVEEFDERFRRSMVRAHDKFAENNKNAAKKLIANGRCPTLDWKSAERETNSSKRSAKCVCYHFNGGAFKARQRDQNERHAPMRICNLIFM